MSLSELLEVRVTTAAKYEQSLRDTHATLTVITSKQIEQFGGQNLYEILDRIAGVSSSFGVLNSVTVRGSKPWTGILQHLGLINGRPFGNLSGAHSLYTSVPLSSIERIEYVRGPGSVLFGTNAYLGVFNIITKQAKVDGWRGEQQFTLGSFGTKSADGSVRFKHQDFNVAFHYLYSDSDGWEAAMFDPELQAFYSRDAFNEERTVHLQASYKNWSFSHFNSHQDRFANFWDAPESRYIPWSKKHPAQQTAISHKYNLSNTWRSEVHFTHLKKVMEWDSQGVADDLIRIRSPLENRLLELNLFGQLTADTDLVVGAAHETREVYDAVTVPDGKEDYASAFFQLQHQLNEQISLNIGAQYMKPLNLVEEADVNSDLVPRLSVNYYFDTHWALKLRYGEAFRHPTSGERTIETPLVQKGTPDLKSESIATTEIQLFYQSDKTLFDLVAYRNKESDLISLIPSDDPNFALQNSNVGKIESYGIELEYKHQFNDHWYLEWSGNYQKNKDEEGTHNVNLSANKSSKLGISFDQHNWQWSVYHLYYSRFHDTILFDPNRELLNPDADGYNWLNIKATRRFTLAAEDASLAVSVELKNLLDEAVYLPNDTPVFYPINTLPARQSRALYVTASLNF